jgi:hypothetical protein
MGPKSEGVPSTSLPVRVAASPGAAIVCILLFLLGLAGQSVYCFLRPTVGFDTIVYVAMLGDSSEQAHRLASAECASEVPGPHSDCSPTDYLSIDSYSPTDFQTFVRFYQVKPLYTGVAGLLVHTLHVSGFKSLRLLSASSYCVMGVVLLLWLGQHLRWPAASLTALLIVSLPPVITTGKFLLPDAFSTALMLAVLYIILYHVRSLWLRLLLLALLPLARSDNIIFSALLGVFLIYRATPDRRQLILRLGGLVVGCAVLNVTLSHATHALSYPVLFDHSFIDFSTPSHYAAMRLVPGVYLHTVLAKAPKAVILLFPLPLLFTALALADPSSWRPMRDLVVAAFLSALARLPLFPAQEERYYTWYMVVAAVGAVTVLAESVPRPSWFAASRVPEPSASSPAAFIL